MTDVDIRAAAYDAPVVRRLVAEMADDLAQFYGPGSYPPQDPARWAAPVGAFLVAYVDGEPAACGGIVRFDDVSAEVKRMFTRPPHRRLGIAARLLSALEETAAELGYRRMVLETGRPQASARAMYAAAGYGEVPCWPPYDADPVSVCFARELAAPSH